MSYLGLPLGGQSSFLSTSGGPGDLPSMGPVAWVKQTIMLESGMIQHPVQQV